MGIQWHHIALAKLTQNGFVESFDGEEGRTWKKRQTWVHDL